MDTDEMAGIGVTLLAGGLLVADLLSGKSADKEKDNPLFDPLEPYNAQQRAKEAAIRERGEGLLKQFPIGSKGEGVMGAGIRPLKYFEQGFITLRLMDPDNHSFNPVPGESLSYDPVPSDAFTIRLVSKETGFLVYVHVRLELPQIQLPEMDIPPYRADQIIPVRNLIRRYIPEGQHINGEAFAQVVKDEFREKTLSLEVVGAVNGSCLSVSCKEVNDAVEGRWWDYFNEWKALKSSLEKGIKPEDIDFDAPPLEPGLWEYSPEPSAENKKSRQFLPRAESLADNGMADALEGRCLLIDGSNVVRHDTRYGWRVLRALIDWLKRNGTDYFLYFDATITHLEMDDEGKSFIKSLLNDSTHTAKCPSRDEADKFILHRADKTGSHVISNDGYTQWEEQYPWVGVRNNAGDCRRVHKFNVEGDYLNVPDLGMYERIIGN